MRRAMDRRAELPGGSPRLADRPAPRRSGAPQPGCLRHCAARPRETGRFAPAGPARAMHRAEQSAPWTSA
ncbi:hypothetical protein IP84_08815 [beta proteobacterium AAP99]|nr:hypothetical protein IP84_08815 [beta proteobacterium AAP99]